MKKRRNVLLVVILLIVTNILTYNLTSWGYGRISKDKFAKMNFLEKFVKENYLYPVTDEELAIGELKGVVAGLNDPYSEYLTKEEYNSLTETTSGKFYGIGVFISNQNDEFITVISPIKDSPADIAGLKAGDKIIKVDDKEYNASQTSEAMKAMRGEKGTEVKITILRPSTGKTKDYNIVRDEIKEETIISSNLNGIGYIGITQFSEDTSKDFKREIEKLQKENINSIIVDLRGNPGGIVDTAAEVADILLPEGMIVYAKDKNKNTVFEFKSDKNFVDLPLVVLINQGSASASEILAGAIRDYNRGTIIGKKSFGKGIVQSAMRFPRGDGIKLTTSEYFSPKGINIHKIGIEPDIEVDLEKDIKGIGIEHINEDAQLQRAMEVLRDEVNK